MKIKKRSIIIPAFALLIGASLAGSISGTVAWYQYSTRVNAAYVGVSGGTSGNLQMRIRDDDYDAESGDWGTRLSISEIQSYLNGTAEEYGKYVEPITSGGLAKDAALPANFYKNPVYGLEGNYEDTWVKAAKSNYVVIPLQLRYVERDGTTSNVAKEVFLTDLLIQGDSANTAAGKKDLSAAVRFHISSYSELAPETKTNRLISKNGGATITYGKLDLDGDGVMDYTYNSDKYGFGGDAKTDLIYGNDGSSQICFSNRTAVYSGQHYDSQGNPAPDNTIYPMVAQTNGLNIVDANKEYDAGQSKSIGSTLESETKFLNVDVTIWIEGWQTFENPTTHKNVSIWDEDYIGSSFDVGFEFAVDPAIDE